MTGLSPRKLSALLLAAYEAAESPGLWSVFLDHLLHLSNAQNGALVAHNLDTGKAVGYSRGIDPDQERRYFEHYSALNPWLPKNNRTPTDGPVVRSEAIVPIASLRRTEFYSDWAKKADVVFSMAANLKIADGEFVYLTLNRGEKRGEHTQEAEQLLDLLIPHLRRALRHRREFERAALLRRTLDDLSLPLFVVDENRRVIEMTRRAELLLTSKRHFRVGSSRVLRAQDSRTQDDIERCLGLLAAHSAPRSRAVQLQTGDEGRRSILVLTRDVGSGLQQPPRRFVLTVLESETTPQQALEAIASVFNLTRAEVRLVMTLLNTGSLDRAIQRLGITRNTARTQMASLFLKTGTRRQGELIQMFSRFTHITHLGDDI